MQSLLFLLSLYHHQPLNEARSACDAVDIFYLIDIASIYEERKLVGNAILSAIARGSNEDSGHSVMIYGDNIPLEIPDVLISIADTYKIHRRERQRDHIKAKLDHAFDIIIHAMDNPSNTNTRKTRISDALYYGFLENKPQRVDTNKMRFGPNVGINEDDDIILIFDYYNALIDERIDRKIMERFAVSKNKKIRFILGDTQSIPQPFEDSYYFQLNQIKRNHTERERFFSTTCPAKIIIDEEHGYDLEIGNHVQYINDSTIDSCHLQFINAEHPSSLSTTSFIYVFDYLDDDTRDTFQENDILIADHHTHLLIQKRGCRLATYYIISVELHQNQTGDYNRNMLKVFVGSVLNPMQYITRIKFVDDTEISQTEFDKTTDFGPNAKFNTQTRRRRMSFVNVPHFSTDLLNDAFVDEANNQPPESVAMLWNPLEGILDVIDDWTVPQFACDLQRRRTLQSVGDWIHDVIVECLRDSDGCGEDLVQRRRRLGFFDDAWGCVGDPIDCGEDLVDCFSDPIECGEDIYEGWFMDWLRDAFEAAAGEIHGEALAAVENSYGDYTQCITTFTMNAQSAVETLSTSFTTLQSKIINQLISLNNTITDQLLLAKDNVERKLSESGISLDAFDTAATSAIGNINTVFSAFEDDIQLQMIESDKKFNEISDALANIIIIANQTLQGFNDTITTRRRLAWYNDLLGDLVEAFEIAVNSAKVVALSAIEETKILAQNSLRDITTELSELKDDLQTAIDAANIDAENWVSAAIEDIQNAYPAFSEIQELLGEMENAITIAGSEIMDWANTAAQEIQKLTDIIADAAKVLEEIARALAELLGAVGSETAEHIESFKWFEDHTLEETVSVSKQIGLVTIAGNGSITINYGASMEADLILYLNLNWDVILGNVDITAYLHGSLQITAYADITFNANLDVFMGEALKWWPPEKVVFAGNIPILWRPWFVMDITANTVPIDIEIFAGIECNYFASFRVGFDASISNFGVSDGLVVNEIMEMSATEPGFDNICEPKFVYDNAVSECGFALGFDFNIDARIGLDIYSYFSTYIHGAFALPFRINLPEMDPIQCGLSSANSMCSENPLKASMGASVDFSVKYAYEWDVDPEDILAIFQVLDVDAGNDAEDYLMNEYNLFAIQINMVIACFDIPGDVINAFLREQCECGDITIHPTTVPTQSPTQITSNPSPLPTVHPTATTSNPSTVPSRIPSYSPTAPTPSPTRGGCAGYVCNGAINCIEENIGSIWLCEFSPSVPSQICADGYVQCSDTVRVFESIGGHSRSCSTAKNECFAMNMELARIENEQQYNDALQYIIDNNIRSYINVLQACIGLNDVDLSNEYRWSDGTIARNAYGTNSFGYPIPNEGWMDGEPGGTYSGDCVMLETTWRGTGYRDVNCNSFGYTPLCSKTQARCCDASHVPTMNPTSPTRSPTLNTHCFGCLNEGQLGVDCDIYYEDCFPGYGCFDESYHCYNTQCADGYDAIGPYLDAFVCSKSVGKVLYPISCSHDDWYSFNTASEQCLLAQIEHEDDYISAISAAAAILHLGSWIGLQHLTGDNIFTYSDSTSASNAYGIKDDGTAQHGRGPWKIDEPALDTIGCVGIDKFDNKYSLESCDSDKIGGALCQKKVYSSQWVLIESKEMDASAASYICKANGMKLAEITSMQQFHLGSRLCGDFDCWIGMYYDAIIDRVYWFSNVDAVDELVVATTAFGVDISNGTVLISSGIWDEMPNFTDTRLLKAVHITKSTRDKSIYKPIEWIEKKSHAICMANNYEWNPNKIDSSLCSDCEFYGYIGQDCWGHHDDSFICDKTIPPTTDPSNTPTKYPTKGPTFATNHPSSAPSFSLNNCPFDFRSGATVIYEAFALILGANQGVIARGSQGKYIMTPYSHFVLKTSEILCGVTLSRPVDSGAENCCYPQSDSYTSYFDWDTDTGANWVDFKNEANTIYAYRRGTVSEGFTYTFLEDPVIHPECRGGKDKFGTFPNRSFEGAEFEPSCQQSAHREIPTSLLDRYLTPWVQCGNTASYCTGIPQSDEPRWMRYGNDGHWVYGLILVQSSVADGDNFLYCGRGTFGGYVPVYGANVCEYALLDAEISSVNGVNINNNEKWKIVSDLTANFMFIISIVIFVCLSFGLMFRNKWRKSKAAGYDVVSQNEV